MTKAQMEIVYVVKKEKSVEIQMLLIREGRSRQQSWQCNIISKK